MDFPTLPRSLFRREPTLEEIDRATSMIKDHESVVKTLDQRAAALRAEIAQLEVIKSGHVNAINRCKGAMTLARRLPDELLAEIFELCAPGWPLAPLRLSAVCATWRRAALAPRVWSCIYADCDEAYVVQRTTYALLRSSDAPLRIYLHSTSSGGELPIIMPLLLQHSFRWRTLDISAPDRTVANVILAACTPACPRLEEVVLTVTVSTTFANPIPPHLVFGPGILHASHLKHLTLSFDALPETLVLPKQATDLRLYLNRMADDSVIRLLRALSNSTALRCFSLCVEDRIEPLTTAETPNPFDYQMSLEFLTLTIPLHGAFILDYLHTPLLRRLHLLSSDKDSGFGHKPTRNILRNFLRRSTPPLELLELYDIDLTSAEYCACFALLPSLEELRLHSTDIYDEAIERLGMLCPKLTHLDLRWCSQLTGAALVELVQNRTPEKASADHSGRLPQRSIPTVTLINCSHVKDADVLELASLTTCRLVHREADDRCRQRGCCNNARYRQRLHLRHIRDFSERRLRLLF